MRKLVFTVAFVVIAIANTFAQACPNGSGPSVCTPSGNYTTPGFYPSYDSLPCVQQGVYYDQTIEFFVPATANSTFGLATVDWVKVDSLSNLPCGLCWATDVTSNQFNGGTLHCIRITGTSYDAVGQFKLRLIVDVRAHIGVLAQTLTNQNAASYGLNYYLRVSPAGVITGTSCACASIDTAVGGNTSTNGGRPPGVPRITSSNGTSFCSNTVDTLTAVVGGFGNNNLYQWYRNGVAIPCATNRRLTITTGGSYTVELMTGCQSATSNPTVITYSPAPPTPSITGNLSFCNGSSTILDAGNNSGGYIGWNWSNNGHYTQTDTITTAGTYTVTVTDGNGCTAASAPVTTTLLPAPSVHLGNDTTFCTPGFVVLNAGNVGSTYAWSTTATSQMITVNADNQYTVTVTGTNNCSATGSIIVTVNQTPSVYLGNDTAICSGNTLMLDAGNIGASFYWAPGGNTSQTLTVMNAGTYIANVSQFNCSASDTIVVTVNPTPTISVDPAGPVTICNGVPQTLTATISAGTIQWYDGAGPILGQTGTTLTVGAIDTVYAIVTLGTCTATSNLVTIDTGSILTPNITPSSPYLCSGGSVLLDAGNNYTTYDWGGGTLTQTNSVSATGPYSVTVTLGGCTGTASTFVNAGLSVPTPSIGGPDSVCPGLAATFDAGAGYTTYNWSNGLGSNQMAYLNTSGTYTVTVTQTGFCGTATAFRQFWLATPPSVNLGNDTTVCSATGLTLNAGNSGGGYSWSDHTSGQTTTVGNSGNYSVTVTSVFGCTASDNINVTVAQSPTVQLGHDTAFCSTGNGLTLRAGNPGATYSWSPGGSTADSLNVSSSNAYSVTVTGANHCASSSLINVTVSPAPIVELGNDTTVCSTGFGGTITLDAGNPGAIYTWSANTAGRGGPPTTQTATINSRGLGGTQNYSVTVTLNGCVGSDSINVTFGRAVTVTVGADTTICYGDSATIIATLQGFVFGNTTYKWSYQNDTTQRIKVGAQGYYTVTATNGGCSSSAGKNVNLNPQLVNHLRDTTICSATTGVTLDAGNVGASYSWSPGGAITQTVTALNGTYRVTVSANGCSVVDSAHVVNNSVNCNFTHAGNILTATPAGGTYQWLMGGTPITGATSSTYTITQSGSYSIQVTVNSCSCTSQAQTITGIDDLIQQINFTAFPNPTTDQVTLSYTLPFDSKVEINLYDLVGNKVAELVNEKQSNGLVYSKQIDLKAFTAGMYILQIGTERGKANTRLVKE